MQVRVCVKKKRKKKKKEREKVFRHCPRPLFHFFLIIATWYCSRLSNIDDTVHTEEEEEEEGSKNGSKENPS